MASSFLLARGAAALVGILSIAFALDRELHCRWLAAHALGFARRPIEYALEEREDARTLALQRQTKVTNVGDELLLDSHGRPRGIRFRYEIRFPQDGEYTPAPYVTPASPASKGVIRVFRSEVSPAPVKFLSDSDGSSLHADYRGNIAYSFVVDTVPGFVIFSPDKARSCIAFLDANQKRAVTTTGAPIKFIIGIDMTTRLFT